MDFSRILNKPFLIKTIEWNTTSVRELVRVNLLSDILDNYLTSVPFKSASLFRTKMCVMAQVSGTAMHSGLALMAAVPHAVPEITNPNMLLPAPHIFLNANESTSVCLEVPFYSNTHLRHTPGTKNTDDSVNSSDYCDIILYVMTRLLAADSASTGLTISIHAMFTEEEFYVPSTDINWVSQSEQTIIDEFVLKPEDGIDDCVARLDKLEKLSYGVFEWKDIVRNFVYFVFAGLTGGLASKFLHFKAESQSEFRAEGLVDTLKSIPTYIFDGIETGARKVTGDLIDAGRMALRAYTGFHNPNSATVDGRVLNSFRNFHNQVDQPTLMEKLDQHGQFDRITQEPIFETLTDEMDMLNILSKPMHMGHFNITSDMKEGELLMSAPISPMVEVDDEDFFYSPLRTFYECSRYWRGCLKIDFQSVMSNFQFCKILVVKTYSSDPNILDSAPSYADVHNLITDTIEFSAGGQIQTVELPYASIYDQIECTKDVAVNAMSHGMVYVYLLQPSTVSGSSPDVIDIHAYMSVGKDFQFYGYHVDSIRQSFGALPPSANKNLKLSETTSTAKFVAESEVTVESSNQASVVNTEEITEPDLMRAVDFKPMMSVRDYIRRIVPVAKIRNENTDPNSPTFGLNVINIAYLLRGIANGQSEYSSDNTSALLSIRRLFYGMNGGIKVKIRIVGAAEANVKFIPPSKVYRPGEAFYRSGTPTRAFVLGQTARYAREAFKTKTYSRGCPYTEIASHSKYLTSSETVTLHEVVIPNYNQNRFVGTVADYYDSTAIEPAGDMGDILIASQPDSKDGEYTPFSIEISLGFTDETRLGFQVFAPMKAVPTASSGDPNVRDSIYAGTDGQGPLYKSNSAPGAYFFRN